MQTFTTGEINQLMDWGKFPRKHRRHYVAQNGKCPYCGIALRLIPPAFGPINKRNAHEPSAEHVVPKSRGETLRLGNKLVAHWICNFVKANRKPYACELLYVDITTEIVIATLPPNDLKCYLGRQSKSQGATK